jgi:ArsR family transcriptional regulator, arsenate/arsenite/antimonite-responsive transcriptional repressor
MVKQLPVLEPLPSAGTCCAPLGEAPLSVEQAAELAVHLKAIADPTRLRLLSLMLARPDLEACTCDLTEPLGLTQPTVTHHLRTLAKAGLIVPDRRVGNFTYYRVVTDALTGLADVLAPSSPAGPSQEKVSHPR